MAILKKIRDVKGETGGRGVRDGVRKKKKTDKQASKESAGDSDTQVVSSGEKHTNKKKGGKAGEHERIASACTQKVLCWIQESAFTK